MDSFRVEMSEQTAENNFFFLSGFSFTTIMNHRTAGEEGGCFFNSSLPLPPASQTLKH